MVKLDERIQRVKSELEEQLCQVNNSVTFSDFL